MDWLGFGLSSRPAWTFGKDDAAGAESFFVEALERWRAAKNLTKFVLVGHSLGAYLAVCYCEKYGARVAHLVLASPCGVPEPPSADTSGKPRPVWLYALSGGNVLFAAGSACLR